MENKQMIHNQLGTDVTIYWPITIDGQEQSLENVDLNLYIQCNRFKKKMDITVEGNTISFTFLGKDQKVAGMYDFILVLNEGSVGQVVLKETNTLHLFN